ncbi:MAG: hypothetical protein CVT76_04460 [Alphaproteobacteria bacterium HGW-Alphaproteobacteria-15]|nr:MAG: hypothetical protein CVT76_04460 [Alphaproteobacteria bacterium HGW-Alphaproteobacteria-15]
MLDDHSPVMGDTEMMADVSPDKPLPPDHETSRVQHGFQFPAWIWGAMLGCYAIFFLSVTLATGSGGRAVFAIVVSMLYTAMYFGLATVLSSIKGHEKPSPLAQGRPLQTWTGPMSSSAVAGQVLAIPLALVVFGIGILLIVVIVT